MAIDKRLEDDIVRMVRNEVGSADPEIVRTVVEEVVRAVAARAAKTSGAGPSTSAAP